MDYNIQQKNYQRQTTAMILAKDGQIPLKQWLDDPQQQDANGFTVAMHLANNKIVPPEEWYHDPLLKNNINQTVAIILSQKEIIPPQLWMHDIDLKDNYSCSIRSNLQYNLPIPTHWKNNELTIFDQACYGLIPEKQKQRTIKQNEDGWTVAMIIAEVQHIPPPKQWYHNPNIKNKYGETVALILARNNVDVPHEWFHNPLTKNNYNYTVALLQARNGTVPDDIWKHDKFVRVKYYDYKNNRYKFYTVQNFLQLKHIKVPEEWYYLPEDSDDNSQAMAQAYQGKIPDEKYQHDPNYTNCNGDTVALILAAQGIIPPEQWHHDPLFKNQVKEQTVAILLSIKGIIPPPEWMHDIDIKDTCDQSIRFNLMKHGFIYINNQFIFQYKTQQLNNICQICYTEGEQEFILSKCKHRICLNCFKQLLKQKTYQFCPICRMEDWYEKIYDFNQ